MEETKQLEVNMAVMGNDIKHIKDTLDKLSKQFEAALTEMRESYVNRSEIEGWRKDHDSRISRLEEWQIWGLRLVVGVVITGIIAAIYNLT